MAWGRWWRSLYPRPPPAYRRRRAQRGVRSGDRQILVFLFAVTAVVVSLSFLSPGNSEVRFGVLTWVLMVIGVVAFLVLYRGGVKVTPLEPPSPPQQAYRGKLRRLAETLGRAERGMRFSQVVVARRVREAFLTRVRNAHNLAEEELATLLARPADLRHLIKDPFLRGFLEDTAPEEEQLLKGQAKGGPFNFRFARGDGFTRGIARVIEAMEAWQ